MFRVVVENATQHAGAAHDVTGHTDERPGHASTQMSRRPSRRASASTTHVCESVCESTDPAVIRSDAVDSADPCPPCLPAAADATHQSTGARPAFAETAAAASADGSPSVSVCAGAPVATLAEELRFTVGSVELVEGTLHLFRENGIPVGEAIGRSRTLCIIAVPATLSAADLCTFVGAHMHDIEHMRIVRDTGKGAARYMALIRFTTQDSADAFFRGFNGRNFNSLNPEVCHVVYVSQVHLYPRKLPRAPSGGVPVEALADADDPLAPPAPPLPTAADGVTEMPTCPVCLERLDTSASGLLTTLCNHTFHCSCLSRWQDDTCPVCRHCMADEEADVAAATACEVCGVHENLWMCLVCGHVGCGRTTHEHAMAHYRATGHTYSIELATQRVWDYTGDGYVHRLIQNRTDGKLVELPDPQTSAMERSRLPPGLLDADNRRIAQEKAEALAFEYTLLLTGQLDVQRSYYEELMAQLLSLIPPEDIERRAVAEQIVFEHTRGASATLGEWESPTAVKPLRDGQGTPTAAPRRQTPSDAGARRAKPQGPPTAAGAAAPAAASTYGARLAGAAGVDAPESATVLALQQRLAQMQAKLEDAERRAAANERERRDMQSQFSAVVDKARTQAEELAFLRDINDTLSNHQKGWESRLEQERAVHQREMAAAHARARDAEEQVRDLMFYLDAQKKLAASSDSVRAELDAGHVLITADAPTSAASGGSKGSTAARLRAQLAAKKHAAAGTSTGEVAGAAATTCASDTAVPVPTGTPASKSTESDDELPSIRLPSSTKACLPRSGKPAGAKRR